MSWGETGLLIGLAVGVVNYVLLGALMKRVEMAETKKVLKTVGLLDLALMPFIGFLVGTYVFG